MAHAQSPAEEVLNTEAEHALTQDQLMAAMTVRDWDQQLSRDHATSTPVQVS